MIPSISPRVVNMHYVANAIYRSGDILQMEETIPETLSGLYGISRVICLKNNHDDSPFIIEAEKRICQAIGIEWLSHPLTNSGKLSYKDISKVPAILTLLQETLPHGGCTLVHCHKGSDRTGVVIACYGLLVLNKTLHEVLEEMESYGAAWYNFGMQWSVKNFAKSIGKGDDK